MCARARARRVSVGEGAESASRVSAPRARSSERSQTAGPDSRVKPPPVHTHTSKPPVCPYTDTGSMCHKENRNRKRNRTREKSPAGRCGGCARGRAFRRRWRAAARPTRARRRRTRRGRAPRAAAPRAGGWDRGGVRRVACACGVRCTRARRARKGPSLSRAAKPVVDRISSRAISASPCGASAADPTARRFGASIVRGFDDTSFRRFGA